MTLLISTEKKMEALGWKFLPYGPNEWQWMKFDETGKRIGFQCDPTWAADLRSLDEVSA